MDRHEPPAPDEFELSDLENQAFLPNGDTAARHARRQPSRLTGWMPPRVRKILSNLSRIRMMIILLCTFIVMVALLTWVDRRPVSITIPLDSVALSAKLAARFSDTTIPKFVLANAPLVFIEKTEKFYPSDLGVHLANTHPALNFTPVDTATLGLANLDTLNDLGGDEIYLTSNENLGKIPKYLHGQAPSETTLKTENAVSAVIVVVEKPEGVIDAFYMYFYTFNQGPTVYGHELGDHLGDWEHNMIRFKGGNPTHIWYSQHEYGEAYLWQAVEKVEGRPLCFSAKGSHANYATRGKHDLHNGNGLVPENLVFDYTSQGRLWDPMLSAYYNTYSTETQKFTPVTGNSTDETPVNYLYFKGNWGDQEYTDDMPEQSIFQGFHKFTGGPQGPWFKHLDREDVCLPHQVPCEVKTSK